MIRMYSKRLLLPYVGVMQVAELGRARAMSLDGENWVIRYALGEKGQLHNRPGSEDPRNNYLLVALIKQGDLETRIQHPLLDFDEVLQLVEKLYEAVSAASIPFKAADRYEYWLLDDADDRPLALLQTSVDAREMGHSVSHPTWLAMPSAELKVEDPEPAANPVYVPPVNYRLQQLVEERAGSKPRAVWYERTEPATDGFPPCLIREDWQEHEHQRLCDLYIRRLAPRLLMMDGLPRAVRERLEQAACEHVFDVEMFYPLYPEVIDDSRLTTARVEARLRRANEG